MMPRFIKTVTILLLSLISSYALSENRSYADDFWLDWKEDEITSFPQFDINKTIPIELDVRSHVQWSVAPSTITLGKDRIVRYVVLAISKSGTVNAMYEGIHCKEGAYKIYARAIGKKNQGQLEWRPIENPEWKTLADEAPNSHARMLAKLVMCDQRSSPTDLRAVIQRLKKPYGAPLSPADRGY